MVDGLLGRKLGMTQVYTDDGIAIPVTVVQAGPCCVMQIKTVDTDGYSAVQLGFADKKKKRSTNPEIGHAGKAQVEPKRFVREIRGEGADTDVEVGQEFTVDMFKDIGAVDITGTTKGKGFAGVMKRWGFSGGPASHGSNCHRIAGSVGAGTNPGRVTKGRKMCGRMGNAKKSIRNLAVVKVDKGKNLLIVKGAVPGANGSYLVVRKSSSLA